MLECILVIEKLLQRCPLLKPVILSWWWTRRMCLLWTGMCCKRGHLSQGITAGDYSA